MIDVDGHNFPNLALMKISAFYKSVGQNVEWWNPDRDYYDVVYMSKVFSDAYSPDLPTPTNTDMVFKAGTGYAIWLEGDKEVYHKNTFDYPLPSPVESQYPDYSLYPQYTGYGQPLKKQTAYGFLTRGCPRGCDFCHVKDKEGRKSVKVADLDMFWRGQGNICLSDPNILACSERENLFEQLISSEAKIDFNQGLDARLLTQASAELLASMKLKLPHFAMDSCEEKEVVARGLRLYAEACRKIKGKWDWRNAKVYVLTNFNTTHAQDMERIKLIQECECQPFVMIYNKPSAPAITRRLQRWTNNTMLYATNNDFTEYQKKAYKTVLTDEN